MFMHAHVCILQDIGSHCEPQDCVNKIKLTLSQEVEPETSWQEASVESKRESRKLIEKR